MTDVAVID